MNKSPRRERRGFLRVFAGSAAALLVPPLAHGAARPASWTWRGIALGARATITVRHPDRALARSAVAQAVAEIRRLERIFSLFEPDAAIARLNRAGVLDDPPAELVEVLALAARIAAQSGGAFDPTVQPLWAAYRDHFASAALPLAPDPEAIARALCLVDYRAVRFDPARIEFGRPGMALTLNGIAQGFITDRVCRVLRVNGLDRVLVDAGEIRALGAGSGWRIGIPGPAGTTRALTLERPRAVATSSPDGFVFEPSGRHHHLFDPLTGGCAGRYRAVTVIAPTAVLADGLSTACAVLDRAHAESLVNAFDDVELQLLTA